MAFSQGADYVPHLLLDTGGAWESGAPFWERVILRTEVTHPLHPRGPAEDMGNDWPVESVGLRGFHQPERDG